MTSMGGALVQSELLLFFVEFAQKAAIELKLPGTHQPTCIFHVYCKDVLLGSIHF